MAGPVTGPKILALLVAEITTALVCLSNETDEWKRPAEDAATVTGAPGSMCTFTLAVPGVETVKKTASTSHWPGGEEVWYDKLSQTVPPAEQAGPGFRRYQKEKYSVYWEAGGGIPVL